MMSNKWVQAALTGGLCLGLWIGSWIAMAFGPQVLFGISYLLIPVTLYLTVRARGSRVS